MVSYFAVAHCRARRVCTANSYGNSKARTKLKGWHISMKLTRNWRLNRTYLCPQLTTIISTVNFCSYTSPCMMNQHGLSGRRMRRRGCCFLTPRSRGSAFFVRGRSPNKYFKQALNVRRGGGVTFLTPCTPSV